MGFNSGFKGLKPKPHLNASNTKRDSNVQGFRKKSKLHFFGIDL